MFLEKVCPHPKSTNMNSFGYWGKVILDLGPTLKDMNVLIRERRERLVTWRYENKHVKTQTEIEVIHFKARDYQKLPAL